MLAPSPSIQLESLFAALGNPQTESAKDEHALAAVAAAGLSTMSYELSQALAVALRDESAERRWLAGEDVFAEVTRRQELGTMQSAVDHWSTRIKRVA